MYTVIYREDIDATTLEDHDAIQQLPTEDVTLDDVIEACETYHVDAELYDAAGFRKGWVHADGNYRLTERHLKEQKMYKIQQPSVGETPEAWTISVRSRTEGSQIAWWRSDSLPDVAAIQAYFAPHDVRVVQYRFLK
jgi:hypothetical protein